jgi:large subunit ribosomal protein L2
MGRPVISQRRGKGSPTYRVPPHKTFRVEYRDLEGKVIDIIDHRIRTAPLAVVQYEDMAKSCIVAPEGLKVGDGIKQVVRKLSDIPAGSTIFAIETKPHSGPKLCLSAGSAAILTSKEGKKCVVQLPSKKEKRLNSECRATVGVPAGDGRTERPWLKAGKKWIAMHAKGKLYPRTSGVKMNPVDHPFGGKARPGKSKSVSRHAPPGRKVGSISPRRTGKRKRK